MLSLLKRLASKLTDKPIHDKVVVTTDDFASFKNLPTREQKEKASRESENAYYVKPSEEVGGFEYDGVCIKDNVKMVRLRHTLSGGIYTFPVSLFEILFPKLPKKVEKHG